MEQEEGYECLDLVVQGFKDWIDGHLISSQGNQSIKDAGANTQSIGAKTRKARIKRVLLWSHHLLATSKRKDIVTWSRELHLGGYSRPGYPGAIFIEGEEDAVDEFVHRIKQLRWQALQVRAEDVFNIRVCGDGKDGVKEVEALGDVVEALKKADQETANMFLEGMKIARGD